MSKKIPVSELQVGMFIIDTGLSWMNHPYLYAQEGLITSSDQIQRIQDEGFLECFIDVLHSHDIDSNPELEIQKSLETLSTKRIKKGRDRVQDEYPQAQRTYQEGLKTVRNFLKNAKYGKILDYYQAESTVEALFNTIGRHPDAIISLSKLRQFDDYTYTHCINVSLFAIALAQFIGWPKIKIKRLGMAGLFHDLGKARVPSELINKPGPLTSQEFEIMKNHPEEGYKLLVKDGEMPEETLQAVLQHHEKPSGMGYPQGLSDDEISYQAKILAVADVYDALTSRRPYKDAIPPYHALRILFEMRGCDFDSNLVEQFIKLVGIYPIGTYVLLSTDEHGLVVENNNVDMLHPVVRVLRSLDGRPVAQRIVDLSKEANITIAGCVDPKLHKIDPAAYILPREVQ